MSIKRKKLGFTLAEVLITLGIIGVVAALTIPVLMNGFIKNQIGTRLQKTYSMIYQAIKLSENDNGTTNTWDYGTTNDGNATLVWFNTYLAPYFKHTADKVCPDSTCLDTSLLDGTTLEFWNFGTFMHVYVMLDTKQRVNGRNTFLFRIDKTATKNTFAPYDYLIDYSTLSRDSWKLGATYGCNNTGGNKQYCAGLIMYDGWQIKDDYPFFN